MLLLSENENLCLTYDTKAEYCRCFGGVSTMSCIRGIIRMSSPSRGFAQSPESRQDSDVLSLDAESYLRNQNFQIQADESFLHSDVSEVRVLVPGAGLGRLAWEIACLGYSCQGNEWSFFMLFSSNFVLNRYKGVRQTLR